MITIRSLRPRFAHVKRNFQLQRSICNLSYHHCLGKQPLVYQTVGDLLETAADKYGDRTALIAAHQDKRLSYSQVKQQADEFAAGLLELGLSRGDRVAIWAPNSAEWYIAKMALARAGLISVYINPAYQPNELKHSLNKVGVRALITAESFKSQNYFTILEQVVPEISSAKPGKIKSSSVPSLESVIFISDTQFPGSFRYSDIPNLLTMSSKEKFDRTSKLVQADDACNIQFTSCMPRNSEKLTTAQNSLLLEDFQKCRRHTAQLLFLYKLLRGGVDDAHLLAGGTTGFPKGAVLSHMNIVNNSLLISKRQGLHLKYHRMCLLGPFFHAMGSVIGILTCVQHGNTMVVPDYSFNPAKCIPTIISEKCTVLLGTPTMYVDILRMMKEQGQKAETPELAISGGALCTPQIFQDMLSTLGVKRVSSVYGMTESGPVSFMSLPCDTLEQMTTTVGCPMEHTEVKVVDGEGRTVAPNTAGELWVRGYLTMMEYWGDEAKTNEIITSDHWLKTGDLFALDNSGYGKIVGRIKDVIIRGGENIYPLEVEEFLNTHPEVIEVQIFGIPDERLGEQVCGCFRLKSGSNLTQTTIKDFCKGKIAHFKIPHYIYFFEDFPKTASGKIQRFKLREAVMNDLKLK